MRSRRVLISALTTFVAVALAGCSSSDSEPQAEGTSSKARTTASSTSAPIADNCLVQIKDLETLKPPVPNRFQSLEAERGSNLLGCTYRNGDLYIIINEIDYQGTYRYGDGSTALDGSTCADGSIMTESIRLTDLPSTKKQLESRIICETQSVKNKYGFDQGARVTSQIEAQAFPEIGEGLYCIIPSNCFLLTQNTMYAITLPRQVNTPLTAARTYDRFGGYEGSKAVASLIVEKANR